MGVVVPHFLIIIFKAHEWKYYLPQDVLNKFTINIIILLTDAQSNVWSIRLVVGRL